MRNPVASDHSRLGSRRHHAGAPVVLTGFALLVAACTGSGTASPAASPGTGGAGSSATSTGTGGHLLLDYRPSQVTGWSAPYSPTIGGHTAARDFARAGNTYRLSLLSFGQPGSAPDPVYERVPSDPVIKFAQTLAKSWGKYYTFRYRRGLPAGARFLVESYSVKISGGPGIVNYGNDLYLVYQPGRRHHPMHTDLQFIQVLWSHGLSVVDSTTANPFYGSGSGVTSIYGNQSASFYDNPHVSQGASGHLRPTVFRAEVFLAQDTGIKNAAGKDIIDIFGGVKWGWQLQSQP